MTIEAHTKAEYEAVVGVQAPNVVAPLRPISELTLGALQTAVENQGLEFGDESLVGRIHSALLTGKHILLQGPPGTGKTELAIAIASAAAGAGVCRGLDQIAGSSDWTPSDTVGTYRLNKEKALEFEPGLILSAISNDHWVVLDELNRAAIDQAMGPFFTVLSGQSVVLRYEEEGPDGELRKVAIVPDGELLGASYRHYEVHPSWRIIATMNTSDVDLLFEISQAFLRRFAIVKVEGPPAATHASLLKAYSTGNASVDAMVRRLSALPSAPLGPAITLDCARYVKARFDAGIEDPRELAIEVLDMFVRPQLVHLNTMDQVVVTKVLTTGVTGAAEDSDAEMAD